MLAEINLGIELNEAGLIGQIYYLCRTRGTETGTYTGMFFGWVHRFIYLGKTSR